MARKPRDYKAEERRRNELARQRGYRTRASLRGAIERGERPALQPSRIRSPKTRAAQDKFIGGSLAAVNRPGLTFDALAAQISDEQRCRDWAAMRARTTVTQYDPSDEMKLSKRGADWNQKANRTQRQKRKWIDQHGMKKYTQAYLDAFVDGPERYHSNRYTGGSEAMRLWFVDITGYMSADEYEARYGHGN